jgi:hypothetical protein
LGKERIAYQVKASLEQAEVTISGVEELSKINELAKDNKEVQKVNKVINLILNHWKPEDLPSDRRRLAQNIILDLLMQLNRFTRTQRNSRTRKGKW